MRHSASSSLQPDSGRPIEPSSALTVIIVWVDDDWLGHNALPWSDLSHSKPLANAFGLLALTVSLIFHNGGEIPFGYQVYTEPTSPSTLITTTLSSTLQAYASHPSIPSTAQAHPELESVSTPIEVLVDSSTAGPGHQLGVYEQGTDTALVEEDMKAIKTKATIGVLATIISYMSLNSIYRATNPEAFIWQDEDREEVSWMATSKSWLDRKTCRWLGICGGMHMHFIQELKPFGHGPQLSQKPPKLTAPRPDWDWQNAWTEGKHRPEDWTGDERVLRDIPDYVLDYAPLVHLFSGEQFWPCDIAEHLYHITPALNYTPLQSEHQHPSLHNLDNLNQWQDGRWVFLTSNDDVEERPDWLEGEKNIPNNPASPDDPFLDNDGWVHTPGRTYLQGLKDAMADLKDWFAPGLQNVENRDDFRSTRFGKADNSKALHKLHHELRRSGADQSGGKLRGGRSDAPAVLITVDKGHGVVDAFWFFFYSFNLGNVVLNVRFGNHVGDWEHTAIRFQHGEPKAVFFSEHNFGSVYSYDAVEKLGRRPVIYSAYGTHAMYATPNTHPYILPWGILHDLTDRGPLWDPALNVHAYTYDHNNDTLRSSNRTPDAPLGWFDFAGHWGDKFYPLNDKRQYRFAGQYHYVNGPLGPKFKNLGRKKICPGPDSAPCVIKNWLGGSDKIGRVHMSNEDGDVYM